MLYCAGAAALFDGVVVTGMAVGAGDAVVPGVFAGVAREGDGAVVFVAFVDRVLRRLGFGAVLLPFFGAAAFVTRFRPVDVRVGGMAR